MGTAVSENSEIVSEASLLVREWAGARGCDDSVKAMIRRAARRLRFTYSRTKALYYREARSVSAAEMDALRKRERQAGDAELIASLRRRIDRIEIALALSNEAGADTQSVGRRDPVHQGG